MDLAAHVWHGSEGFNCPVSCQNECLLPFDPGLHIDLVQNKSYLGLFGLFSLFRLYLAERWVNSTDLSSLVIFFSCFLDISAMLRIHKQLQTGENTQDLSSTTDLRDEAIMEVHLEMTFSNTVRKAHTSGEKKNSAPSTTKVSCQTPCLSMRRRICTPETEKVASERRSQPLMKCESPTKYLIWNRKAPVFSLIGSQDQEMPKENLPWLPTFQTLLTAARPCKQRKPLSALHRWMDAATPSQSPRHPAKGHTPRTHKCSWSQTSSGRRHPKPYYSNSYLQNEYIFMLILGKQMLGSDSGFWEVIAKYRKRKNVREDPLRRN